MIPIAKIVLEQHIVDEIARIGVERAPSEACGILLPFPWNGKQIYELPNRAEKHHDMFTLYGDDIVFTIQDWVDHHPEATWDQISVWHTHPAGQVGPSETDLKERSEHCGNLVVTLTEDKPIATWF